MKKKSKSKAFTFRSCRWLAALLCAALLAAGCGGSPATESSPAAESSGTSSAAAAASASSASADKASKEPVTIRIGSGQTAQTLDVNNAYDGWYLIRFGICQTLTKMNDDMSISGWLAEDDYSANEDNTVWTFHIREGVHFSNGDALTAERAKTSLESLFANSVRGTEYFDPVSFEANGQTLTITTKTPEPILPNKLADPLFSIIDTDADMSNMTENGPVGTGPFVLETFDTTSRECIVVRNENYWGGEVKADRISFYYTEEQSALTNALMTGEFDAVYNVSMTDIADFENNADFTLVRSASGRTTHGFMNQKGVLGDKVLRQAILQNLDKETFCSVQLNGQYIPGKTLTTSSVDYGYNELTDPNSYNPENAVRLLDEAGYADIDGDGFRETPDGQPIDLTFTYYTGRPEQEILVQATCQEMARIGIRITPDLKDTSTVMDKLSSGDYDLLCMSINVLNCADPENHMKTYFGQNGSYSTTGWNNPEFEKLLSQLGKASDPAERREIVIKAEQLLLDDAVCIFYCYPLMNFVTKSNVTGIECTPADYYWVSEATQIG
jgi:peptide/nickel transport system substrate-binding protein